MPSRVLLGVGAATFAAVAAVAVFMVFGGLAAVILDGRSVAIMWRLLSLDIAAFAMFAGLFAVPISLFVGAPLGAWLARGGRTRPSGFLLLGAALGAATMLVFAFYGAWKRSAYTPQGVMQESLFALVSPASLGLGAWCGAWSALAYWAVVYRQRDSRPRSH